jgi:hypothetical protein
MLYRINLENGLSEPYNEAQLISLYQAGAITKESRVKEEESGVDWVQLGTALPFISGVQTTGYIAGKIHVGIAAEKTCIVQRVELPFWHLVGLIFKVSVAAIPAFFLFGLITAYLSYLFTGAVVRHP